MTAEYLTGVAGRRGLPAADVFVLGRLAERQRVLGQQEVSALRDREW